MTQAEGDEIAQMVLRLVLFLKNRVHPSLEPTSTGHLLGDVKHFVQNRSE